MSPEHVKLYIVFVSSLYNIIFFFPQIFTLSSVVFYVYFQFLYYCHIHFVKHYDFMEQLNKNDTVV